MAFPSINIKVTSDEIIIPSKPTPENLRYLQTSLLDRVNSSTLVPFIYFYPQKRINTNINTNGFLDRLKGSLPKTLSMFYPLAGRVHDANYFNCNDEGVPYAVVEVDKPLEDVVHKLATSQLDKLVPLYDEEGFTNLLLAIQINVFTCGGVAIGVRISHSISDGFSLAMFFKTWASMANYNNDHLNLDRPSFEMWKLFPPSLPNVSANQNTDLIKDRPVAKWFRFSESKLDALRYKLMFDTDTSTINTNSNSENCLPSLAMVLSSFIWSRIKVACHNSSNDIPHQVFHAVNLRSRLSPSCEKHYYFGNTFVNAIANLSLVRHDDDNKDESLMREFLEKMKESIAKVLCKDGFIRHLQEGSEDLRFVMEYFEKESRGDIISLGFSNLRSLPLYEADFGWGKPVWVTSATLKYKNLIISLPAAPSTKDIIAFINLSGENMAKLESDTVFTTFVSNS